MRVHVRRRVQGVQLLLMSYDADNELPCEKQRHGLARGVETWSGEKIAA